MTVPLGEAQQGSSHADAEFLHESHKHASFENVIENEAKVGRRRRKLLRRNESAKERKSVEETSGELVARIMTYGRNKPYHSFLFLKRKKNVHIVSLGFFFVLFFPLNYITQ